MPIHHSIAANFHLLKGIDSFQDALADPVLKERLDRVLTPGQPPDLPSVHTRSRSVPGPHGPIPVRIYTDADAGTARPGFVWLHGGAFVGGDRTCQKRIGFPARSVTVPGAW